jgi:transcriptional regulator with XRE-family HTH domain
MINNEMSDKAILKELGLRISRYRLNKNLTQEALATEAGVSRSAVQRAEIGTSIQLFKLIRVLRALNLVENLESFLPEPAVSPIQQLKMKGKIRKRARLSKKKNKRTDWHWGDEE